MLLEAVAIGLAFIVVDVCAVEEQPFALVTVTVYTPVANNETFGIVGYCNVLVKPFGPLQL